MEISWLIRSPDWQIFHVLKVLIILAIVKKSLSDRLKVWSRYFLIVHLRAATLICEKLITDLRHVHFLLRLNHAETDHWFIIIQRGIKQLFLL